MHETFVRPLGEVERQAFYEDMKVVAQLFGTPASVLPGSFSDFQADQRERLESGEIVPTPPARWPRRSAPARAGRPAARTRSARPADGRPTAGESARARDRRTLPSDPLTAFAP
jgi:hypothetical protein